MVNYTGFGSIFYVKFGFYSHVDWVGNNTIIGFLKGEFYDWFDQIVDQLIWYILVVGFLTLLVVILTVKKIERLKWEEKEREEQFKKEEETGKGAFITLEAKNVREAKWWMDFS